MTEASADTPVDLPHDPVAGSGDPAALLGTPVPGWSPPPWPPRAAMVGRRVRLEPADPGRHADALHAANRADATGRMWTWLPYGPFEDAAAHRAWMARSCSGDDPLFFAVVDADGGRPSGLASYLRIAPDAGTIEIGHIAFSPELQRTAAATEALTLMIRCAFGLGYRRIEWKCNALNAPSRRAARRLGFSYEGVFRQAAVVKGRNRDTAWYAMIDAEAPALLAAYDRWLDPANFDAAGRQRERLSDLTAPILVAAG